MLIVFTKLSISLSLKSNGLFIGEGTLMSSISYVTLFLFINLVYSMGSHISIIFSVSLDTTLTLHLIFV